MGKKTFTITSKEACTRCAIFGKETEACVAVKEVMKGVLVHSALCEEHFTHSERKKKKTLFDLFFQKGEN